MHDYKTSDIHIVKAVPKDSENVYGVVAADTITPQRPTIIVIGGELTFTPRSANYYIKQIKTALKSGDVTDADIYSVYYDFGSRDAGVERINLFKRAGHKLRKTGRLQFVIDKHTEAMDSNEPTPRYIEQLYNKVIHPILVLDTNGVQVDGTAQNASYIRFYAHSHGAATLYMLGQYMADKLKEMGVSAADIRKIQRNIIVIQHGPIAPLEHPKFTTLSFISASDTRMNFHNIFSDYVADNWADLPPAYFPQGGAHIFAVGETSTKIGEEHKNDGLVSAQALTDDGILLFEAERNSIVNAMRYSGQPVPKIDKLVDGGNVCLNDLRYNGEWFYALMLQDIKNQRQQIPEHDYQK